MAKGKTTPGRYGDWWTETASPKAWMSVRDADLLEALLHRQAHERRSPLRVLEWGSGRSTLWYPHYLQSTRTRTPMIWSQCPWLSSQQ
jgi:hypothetical protein